MTIILPVLKRIIKYLFWILFLSMMTIYAVTVFMASLKTPKLIEAELSSARISLRLTDLSVEEKRALLAVCDPSFYLHQGVDLKTPGAGTTTITEFLARTLYLDQSRPGNDKIKETLIACLVLNRSVTKDDQLTLFINHAYFGQERGQPISGFANAAQYYYGRSFQRLNWNQYLSLLAMLVDPDYFNVKTNPQANADRVQRIKSVLTGDYRPKSPVDLFYGGKYREDHRGKTYKVINKVFSATNESVTAIKSMIKKALSLAGKKV